MSQSVRGTHLPLSKADCFAGPSRAVILSVVIVLLLPLSSLSDTLAGMFIQGRGVGFGWEGGWGGWVVVTEG